MAGRSFGGVCWDEVGQLCWSSIRWVAPERPANGARAVLDGLLPIDVDQGPLGPRGRRIRATGHASRRAGEARRSSNAGASMCVMPMASNVPAATHRLRVQRLRALPAPRPPPDRSRIGPGGRRWLSVVCRSSEVVGGRRWSVDRRSSLLFIIGRYRPSIIKRGLFERTTSRSKTSGPSIKNVCLKMLVYFCLGKYRVLVSAVRAFTPRRVPSPALHCESPSTTVASLGF